MSDHHTGNAPSFPLKLNKPDSVMDDHSSRPTITDGLKRPTRHIVQNGT